jgi:hypothetical protein
VAEDHVFWVKEFQRQRVRRSLKLAEARRAEEPKGIWTVRSRRRHVSKNRGLWVKVLRENAKEESLKSSKPEQPKCGVLKSIRTVHQGGTRGERLAISEKSFWRKEEVLNENSRRPESRNSSESSVC